MNRFRFPIFFPHHGFLVPIQKPPTVSIHFFAAGFGGFLPPAPQTVLFFHRSGDGCWNSNMRSFSHRQIRFFSPPCSFPHTWLFSPFETFFPPHPPKPLCQNYSLDPLFATNRPVPRRCFFLSFPPVLSTFRSILSFFFFSTRPFLKGL